MLINKRYNAKNSKLKTHRMDKWQLLVWILEPAELDRTTSVQAKESVASDNPLQHYEIDGILMSSKGAALMLHAYFHHYWSLVPFLYQANQKPQAFATTAQTQPK